MVKRRGLKRRAGAGAGGARGAAMRRGRCPVAPYARSVPGVGNSGRVGGSGLGNSGARNAEGSRSDMESGCTAAKSNQICGQFVRGA
eukprot:2281551-Rhodomonas_salina.1